MPFLRISDLTFLTDWWLRRFTRVVLLLYCLYYKRRYIRFLNIHWFNYWIILTLLCWIIWETLWRLWRIYRRMILSSRFHRMMLEWRGDLFSLFTEMDLSFFDLNAILLHCCLLFVLITILLALITCETSKDVWKEVIHILFLLLHKLLNRIWVNLEFKSLLTSGRFCYLRLNEIYGTHPIDFVYQFLVLMNLSCAIHKWFNVILPFASIYLPLCFRLLNYVYDTLRERGLRAAFSFAPFLIYIPQIRIRGYSLVWISSSCTTNTLVSLLN